jgi:hypothetical protein
MRVARNYVRFRVPELAGIYGPANLQQILIAGGHNNMSGKGVGILIVALLLTGGSASAQAGAQAGASGSASAQADKSGAKVSSDSSANGAVQAGKNSADIANGTTMNATLTHPVDAKKNKAGDEVTAKTTEAVRSDGRVIIPKGSTLKGHVTQASARGEGQSESALGITFDRVVMSDGREMPMNFTVRAISSAETMATSSSSFAEGPVMSGGMAGGGAGGSGHSSGGGGVLGGVGSTGGGAVGATGGVVGNVGSAANGTVGNATNVGNAANLNSATNATGSLVGNSRGATGGLNSAGQLTSNSQGVFGLNGLNLQTVAAGTNSTQGTLITSKDRNVHLDSGTQMLLAAQGQATKQ